jgi:hypothetical protein
MKTLTLVSQHPLRFHVSTSTFTLSRSLFPDLSLSHAVFSPILHSPAQLFPNCLLSRVACSRSFTLLRCLLLIFHSPALPFHRSFTLLHCLFTDPSLSCAAFLRIFHSPRWLQEAGAHSHQQVGWLACATNGHFIELKD